MWWLMTNRLMFYLPVILILVDLLSKAPNLPMFFLNVLKLFIAKGFVTVLCSGCMDRMLLYTFKIYELPGGKNAWK